MDPIQSQSVLDFAIIVFEECKLDARTSDLVPIIVGACLAGLVIATDFGEYCKEDLPVFR